MIVVAALLLFGCGSEAASDADRRFVREFDAVLRDLALDARIPAAECTNFPRATLARLRELPQRIAAGRERLARLQVPDGYELARAQLDEGLRLLEEANTILVGWTALDDDPKTGECGQSSDNLRNNAYDEFHDLAKPHLQAFMDAYNPIASRLDATTWQLGAVGLIPR